jgi:hypothetical protein
MLDAPVAKTVADPNDICQRDHPMAFCSVCGTYMHCKDEEGPWRRRVEPDAA